MKKIKYVLLLATMTLALTACNGEFKQHIQSAEAAVAAGDYPSALASYSKAQELKPNDEELSTTVNEVRNSYYAKLIEDAHAYQGKKNYKKSYESYQTAFKIFPGREAELKDEVDQVYASKVKQEELDQYMEWVGPVVKDYQTMLSLWKTELTNYVIGASNREKLTARLKEVLAISTNLQNVVGQNSMTISADLKEFNSQYIEGGIEVNQGIYQMLNLLSQKDSENESIVTQGSELEVLIKAQSTDYLNVLGEYIYVNELTMPKEPEKKETEEKAEEATEKPEEKATPVK